MAVNDEVMAVGAGIHPIEPQPGGGSAIGDVFEALTAQRDVVGRIVAVDTLLVAPRNHKALDDDVGRIEKVYIGIADQLAVQHYRPFVFGLEGDPGCGRSGAIENNRTGGEVRTIPTSDGIHGAAVPHHYGIARSSHHCTLHQCAERRIRRPVS